MRGNLQNAEFIGDKVGNFSDWLNVKIKEMPEAYKALIIEKLAEIEATMTIKPENPSVALTPIEKIQTAEAEIVVNNFETGIIFDTHGNEIGRVVGEESSFTLPLELLKKLKGNHINP